MNIFVTVFCYFVIFLYETNTISIEELNVPPEHVSYVYNLFPNLIKSSKSTLQKSLLHSKNCWGYELTCNKNNSYHIRPRCPGDHRGWVKSKEAQYETFYTQADFGNISVNILNNNIVNY